MSGARVEAVSGVDFWEARVDLWGRASLARVRRQLTLLAASLPVILTIRSAAEGGRWRGTTAERERSYEALLDLIDAVDVESAERTLARAIQRRSQAQRKTLILSFHDFEGTPPTKTLRAKIRAAEDLGADVVKIATRIRSHDDLLRLIEVQARHSHHNLASMGMDRIATLSRLLLASLGSVLVYGAFAKAVAPGQANIRELTGLMRLLPQL
jgi:3-dehydroquinate dehydratase-1